MHSFSKQFHMIVPTLKFFLKLPEYLPAMWETWVRSLGGIPGKIPWRREWLSIPVFLPGESHGQRSLVGCRLWDRTESDTTEATQQQQQSEVMEHGKGRTSINSPYLLFSTRDAKPPLTGQIIGLPTREVEQRVEVILRSSPNSM